MFTIYSFYKDYKVVIYSRFKFFHLDRMIKTSTERNVTKYFRVARGAKLTFYINFLLILLKLKNFKSPFPNNIIIFCLLLHPNLIHYK